MTQNSSTGEVLIEGVFECHSLEDRVRRDAKVYGKTAIPEGRYEIVLTFSNRFQRILPLLLAVPEFEGVRIHPGNTDKNTEGCILVGSGVGEDKVTGSREAFGALFTKLEKVVKKEKVWVNVMNVGCLAPESLA